MATVHITLGQVTGVSTSGASMPVEPSVPIAADTMTSSGTSAQSNITATTSALTHQAAVWTVTATGGNVWAAFGANPTAAAEAGHLILDGQTRNLSVSANAEKIAIKDV